MKLLTFVGNGDFWPLPVYETQLILTARNHEYVTTCIFLSKSTFHEAKSESSSIEFAAYKMLDFLAGHAIEDLLSMNVNNMLLTVVGSNSYISVGLLSKLCISRNWSEPKYKTIEIDSGHFFSRCELMNHVTYCKGNGKKISRQKAANLMLQCLQENPDKNCLFVMNNS